VCGFLSIAVILLTLKQVLNHHEKRGKEKLVKMNRKKGFFVELGRGGGIRR
jgi:hypothetical protein